MQKQAVTQSVGRDTEATLFADALRRGSTAYRTIGALGAMDEPIDKLSDRDRV